MSASPKVLIADDESAMRKILAIYCHQAGYESTLAENGLNALTLAFRNSYDLIITDYEMPLMNGEDLCRQLRQFAWYQQTPIIFISAALAELATEKLAHELGQITCLPKPLDLPKLASLLQCFSATSPPRVPAREATNDKA